ncbi:MAG: hypothetical protein JHC93_08335, partial [Parachlamydiales bacterium]|nr:hypothetical protein [Parachlamydiales bacterium]
IKHTYTGKPYNLLLSTTDSKGLVTEYDYYPNSNLISAKYQRHESSSQFILREFYEYDACAQPICQISDNGSHRDKNNLENVSERKIARTIFNHFGKPCEQSFTYLDIHGLEVSMGKKVTEYNENAKPVKEIVFNSNNELFTVTSYEYDHKCRLIKEVNPLGHIITHEYDANNNEIVSQGPNQNIRCVKSFDCSNRVIKEDVIHPNQTFTSLNTYDYLGNCISSTDQFGSVTTNEYDSFSRIIKTIAPPVNGVNPTIYKSYNIFGYMTSAQDAAGYVTKTDYTVTGKPTRIENPDGSKQTIVYDIDGSITSSTDPNGSTSYMTYDLLGRITYIKTLSSSGEILDTTSFVYNTFHLISKTDGMGNTTNYEYDAAGRLVTEYTSKSRAEFSYDASERQNKRKFWTGTNQDEFFTEVTVFNVLNQVTEERTEDAHGNICKKTTYVYDEMGNVLETTNLLDFDRTTITRMEFNTMCEPVKITDSLGNVSTNDYQYFTNGQGISKVSTSCDPLGQKTISTFNSYGKPITLQMISSVGKILKTQNFFYDAAFNLIDFEEDIYSEGVFLRKYIVKSEYGPGARKDKEILAYGTPDAKTTLFKYDEAGRLDQKIKPDGVILFHRYDGKGRLKTLESSSNENVKAIQYDYTYDCNSNVLTSHDFKSNITTIRAYNNNELVNETLGHGYKISYCYDRTHRKTATIFQDNSRIDYIYSPLNLSKVQRTQNNGKVLSFDFELRSASGKVKKLKTPIGNIEYCYDLLDRAISIQAPNFNEDKIGFDPCGNIVHLSWTDSLGTIPCNYGYDDLYQLTHEDGLSSHDISYDSLNNRLTADNQQYHTNNLNQYTEAGKSALKYDLCGNLISEIDEDTQIHYVYDALDRLVEIIRNDVRKATYTYDSFHRRIAKHTYLKEDSNWVPQSSLFYIYDDIKEIGAVDTSGKIVELRTLSTTYSSEIGSALLIELDQEVYFPIHDHRGCVVSLSNEQGNILEFYRYGAFGEEKIYNSQKIRLSESFLENPWRFSSKRYDEESGLTYFGRRFYNANLGRWITQDPEGFIDGYNLYAYVQNRCLTRNDAYGLFQLPNLDIQRDFEVSGYDGIKHVARWNPETKTCNVVSGYWDKSETKQNFEYANGIFCNVERTPMNVQKTFFTKIQNTGNPFVTTFGLYDLPDNLYAIAAHGQFTGPDEAINFGITSTNVLGNYKVDVLVHPMENLVSDTVYYLSLAAGLAPQMPREWGQAINTQLALGKHVFAILHSRATLVAYEAFKNNILDPSVKERLHCVTVGAARYMEKGKSKTAYNFVNSSDPVPQCIANAHRLKDIIFHPFQQKSYNIKILHQHSNFLNPIESHAYENPGYQKAISKSFNFLTGLK